MWKLVCFSVWQESSFSWWVNSFEWSVLVCLSLISGIPQIFVFTCSVQGSFQINRLLDINNKEDTMCRTSHYLYYRQGKEANTWTWQLYMKKQIQETLLIKPLSQTTLWALCPLLKSSVNSAFSKKGSPSGQPVYFAEASAAKQNTTQKWA